MNANQFLLMIGCLLCLALGAIAVNQVSLDTDPAPTIQVMEPTSSPSDTTDGVRL
jgi:hypothetical protein